MLHPTRSFSPAKRIDLMIRDIQAFDPESGAELTCSRGRTSKAPKWFLLFGEKYDADGHYRPYKEWRHVFRAWTLEEAIEHANKKLPALLAR